jgi:predicted  nucleic acid-binding Zn-ribbon protein
LRSATARLEALRESLEETNARDTEAEEKALADFNTTIGELTTTRRNIAAAKAESEGQLAQAEAALSLQESILSEAVNELASAQTGLANKIATCEDWTATWERNKEARNVELNLIGQVQNIIATKLDTATMLLQKRTV